MYLKTICVWEFDGILHLQLALITYYSTFDICLLKPPAVMISLFISHDPLFIPLKNWFYTKPINPYRGPQLKRSDRL